MDPLTLGYYAIVCGLLAGFVPRASRAFRFALGIGVGLVAASLLPLLHSTTGY